MSTLNKIVYGPTPSGNTAIPVLTIAMPPRDDDGNIILGGDPILQRVSTYVHRKSLTRVSNPKPTEFDKPLDRALSDQEWIEVMRWARDVLSHSIITNTPAGEAERQRWGAEILRYPGTDRFLGVSLLLWDQKYGVIRLLLALGSAGKDNTEDNLNAWHENLRGFMLSPEFSRRPAELSVDDELYKRWISAPDISRVTRDEEHSLRLFTPSQQIGVLWDFGGEILDSTGPDARDRWIDLVAQAAKERRRTIKRTQRGAASLARRGEWVEGVNTTPIGTRPANEQQTKGSCLLAYDPQTHPVLITLVKAGLKGNGTAEQLTLQGIARELWDQHQYRSRDSKAKDRPIHECSNGGAVVVGALYDQRKLQAYRDGTYAWEMHNGLKNDRHLGAGHEFQPEYPGDPYGILRYPIPVPAPPGGWLRRHTLNGKGELVDLPDGAPNTPLSEQRRIWDLLIELRSTDEPGEDTTTHGGPSERSLGTGWMWFDTPDEKDATTQYRTEPRSQNGLRSILIAQRPAAQSRHVQVDGTPGLLRGWYRSTDDIRTHAWCDHTTWSERYADTWDALIESLVAEGVTLDAAALPDAAGSGTEPSPDGGRDQRKRESLCARIATQTGKIEELEERLAGREVLGKDTTEVENDLQQARAELADFTAELAALTETAAIPIPTQRQEVDVDSLDPFAAYSAAVRAAANGPASEAVRTTMNRLTPPGRVALSTDRSLLTFRTTARIPTPDGFVERPFSFTVPNLYGTHWAARASRTREPGDGLLSTDERVQLNMVAVLRDGQDVDVAADLTNMQRPWVLARMQRLWDPERVVNKGLRSVLFRAPVSTRQAVWHGHEQTLAPAHLDPGFVVGAAAIYRSTKPWSVRHWPQGQLMQERAEALVIALSLPDPSVGVPAKALTRMLAASRWTAANISVRRAYVTGLPSMQRVLRRPDGTVIVGDTAWNGGQFAELYAAQRVRPVPCPWTDCQSKWATLLLACPETVHMGTGLGPDGTDLDQGTMVICAGCHRGPHSRVRYPDDVVARAVDPLAVVSGQWRSCGWRSCRRDDGAGAGKVWVFDSARAAGGPFFHDDLCRRHEHLPPDYETVPCAGVDCVHTFTRARIQRGVPRVFCSVDCRQRTELARLAADKVKTVVINCRYVDCTVESGHGPGKVGQVWAGGSGGRSTYHGPECKKAEQRRRRGLPPLTAAWTKCGYDQCAQTEDDGQPGYFPTGDGRRSFHDNNCRRKAVTAQRRGASNGFVRCGWSSCTRDDGDGIGSLRLPEDGSSRNRRFHPQCQALRRGRR